MISNELMVEMLRRMLRIRRFDDHATELVKRGEVPGAIHTTKNQEATAVGATMALRPDDYMTGNHRSHGHPIGKGADLKGLMAELMGKASGVCKGKGGTMHLADFSVGSLGESGVIASAVPVAVGAGVSIQQRGTDQVCLAFFGDGASNAGAIHESMNLASIWKLPVVFFCENNAWAVATAASYSTSVENIADRAVAYSMPGEICDGQDVLAVYDVTCRAVERARQGEGPSLVEAKTYRVTEHAIGLPVPERYRDQDEVEQWLANDPIERFARRLVADGVLSEDEVQAVREEIEAEVLAAIEFALASEYPAPEATFEDLYSMPIPALERP